MENILNLSEIITLRIFKFFIESHDFNGIPLSTLKSEFKISTSDLTDLLIPLVKDGKVCIQSSTNPHIIHSWHYPIESQIDVLDRSRDIEEKEEKIGDITFISPGTEYPICLYPTPEYLREHRNLDEFHGLPYTEQLALATPQLTPAFFEIDVLERYYSDPRYRFKLDDYSGSIYTHYGEDEKPLVQEKDEVFIKTFGLGFTVDDRRLAVVFLRYLKELTKEHQQYWLSKQSTEPENSIVREYIENTIKGNWTFTHSIFSAFLAELKLINKLSAACFGKELFKQIFEHEKKPKEFTFFFTPTLKNYNSFVSLLDKMLSENIDKKFFDGKVELYNYKMIDQETRERTAKGTITLLKDWLELNYNFENPDAIDEILKPLRTVRNERQYPAHKIDEDRYDVTFVDKQKHTISEAYRSLNAIRTILCQDPKSNGIQVPEWLEEGKIAIF